MPPAYMHVHPYKRCKQNGGPLAKTLLHSATKTELDSSGAAAPSAAKGLFLKCLTQMCDLPPR